MGLYTINMYADNSKAILNQLNKATASVSPNHMHLLFSLPCSSKAAIMSCHVAGVWMVLLSKNIPAFQLSQTKELRNN